jgi:hypothetical protein
MVSGMQAFEIGDGGLGRGMARRPQREQRERVSAQRVRALPVLPDLRGGDGLPARVARAPQFKALPPQCTA